MTPLHLIVTIIGTAYSPAQLVRFIVWLDTPRNPSKVENRKANGRKNSSFLGLYNSTLLGALEILRLRGLRGAARSKSGTSHGLIVPSARMELTGHVAKTPDGKGRNRLRFFVVDIRPDAESTETA